MFNPMSPSSPLPTAEHVARYLRHLELDRHLAASTVEGYGAELGLLVTRRVSLEPASLAAFVSLAPAGGLLAPNTRNRRLAILRGFCRYLVARGELSADPTTSIQRARVPRDHVPGLTVADLRAVFAALREEHPSPRRIRDEAIFSLLFYTGLRISELLSLAVDQVDLGVAVLRQAMRKGGGRTDVVLAPPAATSLAAWLSQRPGEATGPVFTSRGSRRLSVRQVQKRLAELGDRVGLGDRLHPHALRHTHATALLRVGVDVELVRRSMNHASLATTGRYLHSDDGLLRQALARLPSLDGGEEAACPR